MKHNQSNIPSAPLFALREIVSADSPPPHDRSITSIAAAASIEHDRGRQQRVILDLLRITPQGMTREQLEHATGFSGNAVRPRCVELIRSGAIWEDGERATKSGRGAKVLRVRGEA